MITLEQAIQDYPSIGATSGDSEVSSKYSFVSTENLIRNFQKLGLTLESVQTPKTKKSKRYAKHMVRMNMPVEYHEEDSIPQILIINSHNRTCGLTIQLGVFRLVCSNGLIITESSYEKFRKRHIALNLKEAEDIMKEAILAFKEMYDNIKKFKNFILTKEQKREFVNDAINMVYNKRSNLYEMVEFNTPNREEDKEDNIYNVMNVIQEAVIKGENYYYTKKGLRKSKEVKSIDREIKINTLLWGLMNQFYESNSK